MKIATRLENQLKIFTSSEKSTCEHLLSPKKKPPHTSVWNNLSYLSGHVDISWKPEDIRVRSVVPNMKFFLNLTFTPRSLEGSTPPLECLHDIGDLSLECNHFFPVKLSWYTLLRNSHIRDHSVENVLIMLQLLKLLRWHRLRKASFIS